MHGLVEQWEVDLACKNLLQLQKLQNFCCWGNSDLISVTALNSAM